VSQKNIILFPSLDQSRPPCGFPFFSARSPSFSQRSTFCFTHPLPPGRFFLFQKGHLCFPIFPPFTSGCPGVFFVLLSTSTYPQTYCLFFSLPAGEPLLNTFGFSSPPVSLLFRDRQAPSLQTSRACVSSREQGGDFLAYQASLFLFLLTQREPSSLTHCFGGSTIFLDVSS